MKLSRESALGRGSLRRKPFSRTHLHPEPFLKSQFEPAKNKNPISDKLEKAAAIVMEQAEALRKEWT
jgi:hypothetical protein